MDPKIDAFIPEPSWILLEIEHETRKSARADFATAILCVANCWFSQESAIHHDRSVEDLSVSRGRRRRGQGRKPPHHGIRERPSLIGIRMIGWKMECGDSIVAVYFQRLSKGNTPLSEAIVGCHDENWPALQRVYLRLKTPSCRVANCLARESF